MFLTDDELLTLTGYATSAARCRWLSSHGWTFTRAATGRPIVLRKHAEFMLSGESVKRTDPQLNLSVIRR